MEFNRRRSLIISSFIVSLILIIVLVVMKRFFITFEMKGISMNPVYNENDLLMVLKTDDIKAGDAIAYQTEDGAYIIKRVIALPGQSVVIDDDDKIYIDGELFESSYIHIDEDTESYAGGMSYDLADDEYFVLGDNLHHSIDSRATGPVKAEKITGKVVYNFAGIFSKFRK